MDAEESAASDQEAGLPPFSESILAIDVKDRSALGCSLFSTADGTLKIGTDISMAGEDVVEQFLSYAQPTTILVSRRVPESIVAFIEKHAEKSDKEIRVRLASPSDFSHTLACEELSSLDTPSANVERQYIESSTQALQECDRQESRCTKLVRCSSSIDLDNVTSGTLKRFVSRSLELREVATAFSSNADQNDIVNKIIVRIVPVSLALVGDMINRVINFDEAKSQKYFSVRPGVDPELDAFKRQYDGMNSYLAAVTSRVAEDLPAWARQYIHSCVFLPQLGFLTIVEQGSQLENDMFNGESINDNSWRKYFTNKGTTYYKNCHMDDLDRHHGDMYSKIGDKEVEVMQKLATDVIVHEKALLEAADLCGEFDALLALAIGAAKYGWHPPKMTDANVIHIKGGRHPLQELLVPSFVPNDCFIGEESTTHGRATQALVLTGPNQSGKSVYIKQVAIIVYLAHIGSYVPAEEAVIGTVDKILTRMPSQESVSRVGSAFATDLKQVFQAMKYSTSRSLVLMDEFGNGTAADGGAG
ncbi:hypothetical protein ACHAPX_006837, partial [Trichoderma viride]